MTVAIWGIGIENSGPVFRVPDPIKSAAPLDYPHTHYFQRFASDAIGNFTLTLTNVVVGSRVHVEKLSDGTSFYDDLAAASTVVISLSAYTAGSAYNDLKIKVRKGTSTAYKPYETLVAAIVGSSSVYVSQIPDE